MDLEERINGFVSDGVKFELSSSNELEVGIPSTLSYLKDEISELKPQIKRILFPDSIPPNGNGKYSPKKPVLVPLSTVEPVPISWLWPGRIALGKLTIIGGDPGLGKSYLSLDIASRTSRGSTWPDDSDVRAPLGTVLILSSEDDLADTIRPRIDALGGDPEKITALTGISLSDDHDKVADVDLCRDIETIEVALQELGDVRLIIIDPVSAYIGRIDAHRDNEVRSALKPLSDLAAKYGVAIVGVAHLNKGTGKSIYRLMGSLAFTAAARSVWAVVKDKQSPELRLFLPVKNNIGQDQDGLSYLMVFPSDAAGYLEWQDGAIDVSADDALDSSPGDSDEKSAKDEAIDWLEEFLSKGPVAARDIKRAANQDGIAARTLDRAKADLKVRARRNGPQGIWTWELPRELAVTFVPTGQTG